MNIGSLFFLIVTTAYSAKVDSVNGYEWAVPTRLAVATCSQFSGVSALPLTSETVSLLERCVVDELHLPPDHADFWNNGSASEFLEWMHGIAKKGDPHTTLLLYFATHQWSDGRTKFTRGPNMKPEDLIQAINDAGHHYQRILFINDSCYAAKLENCGRFSNNILRFYSSAEEERAVDLYFDHGPYGLQHFIQKERAFLHSKMQWDPQGMTFLGLIGLKTGLLLTGKHIETVDLQSFVQKMNQFRELYNEEIRQARAQHFILVPATSNFVILKPVSSQEVR